MVKRESIINKENDIFVPVYIETNVIIYRLLYVIGLDQSEGKRFCGGE